MKTISTVESDDPIFTSKHDLLNRGAIADSLANYILALNSSSSITISLNAPWGAGKTSLLYLLEEKIKDKSGEKSPVIIWFNPWHFNSVDEIIHEFYYVISRGLGKNRFFSIKRKLSNIFARIGGIATYYDTTWGAIIGFIKNMLFFESNIHELKKKLNNTVCKYDKKIIIFIDDIDRLERKYIKKIFRMIRLNLDIPNVIFVLAYDPNIIVDSLNENINFIDKYDKKENERSISMCAAQSYLEKIVQVKFDIPVTDPVIFNDIITNYLQKVFDELNINEIDKQRWGNLYYSGFESHFSTIRQIKQFSNSIRLTLPIIKNEINVVDFLGISVIRIFHPKIYSKLANSKEIITFNPKNDIIPEQMGPLKSWIEELYNMINSEYRQSVINIIRFLFPKIDSIMDDETISSDSLYLQWQKDRNICSPEVFDKYFVLNVNKGDISESSYIEFIKNAGDINKTIFHIEEALRENYAPRLLQRLARFPEDIEYKDIEPFISVLFEVGDKLSFEKPGMFKISGDQLISIIINGILNRIESNDEQFDLLLKSIKNGSALYTIVHIVSLVEDKKKVENALVFEKNKWENLRNFALNNIRNSLKSGELWHVHKLPYVLFRWNDWCEDNEAIKEIALYIEDSDNLIFLMSKFISKTYSAELNDFIGQEHEYINSSELEKLFGLNKILSRLNSIADEGGKREKVVKNLINLIEKGEKLS